MKTQIYKNLEWYIINETSEEKLLFLKDSFTNEQVLKYFMDKSMVFLNYYIQFSKKIDSLWFRDSYIREVLNTLFLDDLDKSDLNEMKTTVTLGNESVTTKDYVRLITQEEVLKLSKEVLKTEKEYGYWTMSPSYFNGSYAFVFFVCGSADPGYLYDTYVSAAYAVRPVISLKSGNLISNPSINEEELKKVMAKVRRYTMI